MIVKIQKIKKDDGTGYNFQVLPEQSKEDIRDFHLFCISIIKDLLEKKFKLNESGQFTYDLSEINEDDLEDTSLVLHYIYNIIYKEKIDLDNQTDDLLK